MDTVLDQQVAAFEAHVQGHARAIVSQAFARRAAPDDLARSLEPLVAWARGQLAQFPGGEPVVRRCASALDRLVHDEVARYQVALAPPPAPPAAPAPALASIFSNAETTAKEVPWYGVKHKESAVLHCPHCGGPQEAALDFVCRYCKKPMNV